MMKSMLVILSLMTCALSAQFPPQPARQRGPEGPPPQPQHQQQPQRQSRPQGPMPGMPMGPPGMWWQDDELAKRLGITADQQKRISDAFQQNRVKMIDLNATLQKEEVTLEPLMQADQPEDAKILAQIDRVAQARAELEKNHAKMLLAIRHVLTPEQWKKLQAENRRPSGAPGTLPGGVPSGPPPPRPEE